jgi:hypothetical protein
MERLKTFGGLNNGVNTVFYRPRDVLAGKRSKRSSKIRMLFERIIAGTIRSRCWGGYFDLGFYRRH